jgi:hypothetical protein
MHPGEGDEELSERKDKASLGGPDSSKTKRRTRNRDGTGRSRAGDVGKALRSVYDVTLREDVPSDFLDLLGKLK